MTTALWPALRSAAPKTPPETELLEFLEAAHGLNRLRNDRLREQAVELTGILNGAGVEPVFLKGMALLLLGLAADHGSRLIVDIDVLIPMDRFEAAAQALRASGYRDLNAPRPETHDRARLSRAGMPACVELHQFPVPYHIEGLIPTQAVLDQSRPLPMRAPVRARTPAPEHLVVHNIVHAMLHHRGFRLSEVSLRDVLDLSLLARCFGDEIDWGRIERRLAVDPAAAAALQFYLGACRALLPEAALPDLAPGEKALAALRRWRRRDGGPAPGRAHLSMRVLEFGQDLSWRLRHVPDQRRRLLAIFLTPQRYPERARHLVDAIRYGVIPLPDRRGASSRSRPEH